MSEKSITRQQAGLVRREERDVGTPLISLGPLLVASSLCRGREKPMMRESRRSKSEIPAKLIRTEEDLDGSQLCERHPAAVS